MRRTSVAIAVAVCVMLVGADAAIGAGFEVAELSVRSLGNAYAGKAASGDDAGIAFFNPAGMTLYENYELAVPIHLLRTTGKWNDEGSTGVLGGSLGGGDGGDPGGLTVIPCLYFIAPITEDLRVGLSVNAPFGLTTDYESKWQGRYFALESSLVTFNINPSVAYRLDETFSIGAGVSWQYAEATLSNAVDFGTIGFSVLGPPTAGALGLSPEGNDGEAKIEGDSYAFGWNVGALIEFSESTRVGIAYRSQMMHKIKGDAKFRVPSEAQVLTSTGAFTNTEGEARLKLPDQAYISLYTEIDDQWALLFDVTWTGWSVFEELRIKFDNPAQPDAVTKENWKSVMRYSVGATYRPTEEVAVRIGAAYDESPIPDEFRTPRIPTNDRYWAAIGASWQITEMFSVDLSYMHVFIKDGKIDKTSSTGQRLKGKFEGSADVLGLQLNVSF